MAPEGIRYVGTQDDMIAELRRQADAIDGSAPTTGRGGRVLAAGNTKAAGMREAAALLERWELPGSPNGHQAGGEGGWQS